MRKIKVYGTTWCGDCIRAKSFMDENGIGYEWTDVDEETKLSLIHISEPTRPY